MSNSPAVAIVCGSKSDLPVLEGTEKMLDKLGVSYEITVASAHRSPAKVLEFCRRADAAGSQVIIAAAGHAAHLAGVVAAHTTLPVLGLPIPSSDLQGLDSLLAMVQMPGGVPVGVMALGRAGAKNAAVFAAQIIATSDEALKARLLNYKAELAEG